MTLWVQLTNRRHNGRKHYGREFSVTEIPDWAGKRACELLSAEGAHLYYQWPRDAHVMAVRTVAKLVMQHETPPVDPDEEAVKRIFASVGAVFMEGPYRAVMELDADALARAVAQFKKERENG